MELSNQQRRSLKLMRKRFRSIASRKEEIAQAYIHKLETEDIPRDRNTVYQLVIKTQLEAVRELRRIANAAEVFLVTNNYDPDQLKRFQENAITFIDKSAIIWEELKPLLTQDLPDYRFP